MQLSIAFRHMDATEAIKYYCKEKVDRITKYFPDPLKAHVVFSTERGYQHLADVTITLHNGIVIKGVEATEDLYSSIDLVMAKIERQVRRYKERIKSHRAANDTDVEIRHSVMSLPSEAAPAEESATPQNPRPQVIRKSKFFAQPLGVDEAVMQMNLRGNSFLVFTNADTREVNVIYKREDGTYGLIETGPGARLDT